ncbi:MAG: hypothetical protein HYX67_01925 [Candidatus Melainabacteria bacterium]|nr:hypothetical protein [Candidatus Melainabacteria bacterium]
MDFRDNLHASAKPLSLDVGPLQQEANSSRFSLVGSIQAGLAEIPTPVVVGAGAVAGIAARLPGELGTVGKIAAAGIGATVLGDAASRTFSRADNAVNAIVNGREGSNVVRLADFMKVPQPGVKRVIQDVEIAQFDAATQTQIRESIAAMVKNGHKSEFLMLSKDGKVLIDREAIETAADIAAFKKP